MNGFATLLIFLAIGMLVLAIFMASKGAPAHEAYAVVGISVVVIVAAIAVQKIWPLLVHTLILKTSSGDIQALVSRNSGHVFAVQGAIERAFVLRG
jgi:uncharacterized membrane protein (UPF0182 family)